VVLTIRLYTVIRHTIPADRRFPPTRCGQADAVAWWNVV